MDDLPAQRGRPEPGQHAYVVYVPQSLRAPHQAGDRRYYKRYNAQSVPMEDYEVRDVARRTDTPVILVLNKVDLLKDKALLLPLIEEYRSVYEFADYVPVSAVKNTGLDIKSASAGPGAIVYEQFGSIHLYDLAAGKSNPVNIRLAGDLPQVRSHFVDVSRRC